jgi:hypothetical protein
MVSLGSRAFRERIAANAVPDTPIVCHRARGVKGYRSSPPVKAEAPPPPPSPAVVTPSPDKPVSALCRVARGYNPPPQSPATSLPVFTRRTSLPVEQIQRVVAGFYRIDVFNLVNSRRRGFLHARCVAIFLAHQLTWETPKEIGLHFNRSVYSVLACSRSIKKAAETNAKLVSNIRKIHWLLIEKSESELLELFIGAYPLAPYSSPST